jgi:hypothetical protein
MRAKANEPAGMASKLLTDDRAAADEPNKNDPVARIKVRERRACAMVPGEDGRAGGGP